MRTDWQTGYICTSWAKFLIYPGPATEPTSRSTRGHMRSTSATFLTVSMLPTPRRGFRHTRRESMGSSVLPFMSAAGASSAEATRVMSRGTSWSVRRGNARRPPLASSPSARMSSGSFSPRPGQLPSRISTRSWTFLSNGLAKNGSKKVQNLL